jgi:hypothetical protein
VPINMNVCMYARTYVCMYVCTWVDYLSRNSAYLTVHMSLHRYLIQFSFNRTEYLVHVPANIFPIVTYIYLHMCVGGVF